MSDQERISPYYINKESSRQVRRIKKKTQLGGYKLIQYQILQIKIISILWQTIGRIIIEILGGRGLIQSDCLIQVLLYFAFHIVHSLQASTNGTK